MEEEGISDLFLVAALLLVLYNRNRLKRQRLKHHLQLLMHHHNHLSNLRLYSRNRLVLGLVLGEVERIFSGAVEGEVIF